MLEQRAETSTVMEKGTYCALPKEQQEKNRHVSAKIMIVGTDATNITDNQGELANVAFLQQEAEEL